MCGSHFFSNYSVINHENIVHVALHNFFAQIESCLLYTSAQRLGISKIKIELDDLALRYLQPDVYYDLAEKIASRKSEREAFVSAIVDEVSECMKQGGIKAQISGRVKHFFSRCV